MDRECPEGVFVESTAVSVCPALALSACYTFFKPVLNLQNSRPIPVVEPVVEPIPVVESIPLPEPVLVVEPVPEMNPIPAIPILSILKVNTIPIPIPKKAES